MSRFTRLIAFALFANIAVTGQAFAHAHLKSATPEGSQIVTTPAQLNLVFSEGLNLKFSKVTVTAPDKKIVRLGTPTLTDSGRTLVLPVPDKLPPGTYTVNWNVLSRDGHKTHGSYTFTVEL